jgi:hypothetical protein
MKLCTVFFAALLITACNSNQSTENTTANQSTAATTPAPAPSTPAEAEKTKVSFKVNDSLARTAKGTAAGDRDEHIGLYTEASKSLSFSLMGDVPGRPHRGWLTFSILNFKFEPSSYTVSKDNHASFSRYETENAGGETIFSASGYDVDKGTEMSFAITKITPDPESFNGRDWLASGTFTASMLVKEANPYKRTSIQSLKITEGTFENVRIAGGPKTK